jgi:hypothetical protein
MGTDTEKIQAVTDFLKKTEKGKIIYPGALREGCGMDMKEIYGVLHELSRTGKIDEILEQRCPHCKNAAGITYRTIGEVPDEMLCPRCGNRIQFPLGHTFVVYRIPDDENGTQCLSPQN